MAIMYLSEEHFTGPLEQISLYLPVLKQFTLMETVQNHADINSSKQMTLMETVQNHADIISSKQFTLKEPVQNHADINSLVSSVDPDQLASKEAS